jgi:hypothetical protein
MEKKVLQDIYPHGDLKKSVPVRKWDYAKKDSGGIVPSGGNEDKEPIQQQPEKEEIVLPPDVTSDSARNWKDIVGVSGAWASVIGIVLVLIAFVILRTVFATAKVGVVLLQQTETLTNSRFVAVLNSSPLAGKDDNVPYQIIKMSASSSVDLMPKEEKQISTKASGTITVANEGKAMTFRATTRFESTDGKIYRTTKEIIIPAAKKDSKGKLIASGIVKVTVVADQPGAEYNIGTGAEGSRDFTVPGLKGSASYDLVSAKTDPDVGITGGFAGVSKLVSDEEILKVSKEQQDKLQNDLMARVSSEINDTFFYTPETIFVTFTTDVPKDVGENGKLRIQENGLLQAIVFDKNELSKAVSKRGLSAYDGSPIVVKNLDTLTFSFEDKGAFDVNKSEMFTFTLSGNPHFVWEIDTKRLQQALTGVPITEVVNVAKKFPSIRAIHPSVKPFWKSSLPSKTSAITIVEEEQ